MHGVLENVKFMLAILQLRSIKYVCLLDVVIHN